MALFPNTRMVFSSTCPKVTSSIEELARLYPKAQCYLGNQILERQFEEMHSGFRKNGKHLKLENVQTLTSRGLEEVLNLYRRAISVFTLGCGQISTQCLKQIKSRFPNIFIAVLGNQISLDQFNKMETSFWRANGYLDVSFATNLTYEGEAQLHRQSEW